MNRFFCFFLGLLVFGLVIPGWAGTIIIDDYDPGCTLSGTWADNLGKNPEGKMYGGEGCVHGSYHFTSVNGSYRKTGREKASWTPNLPQAGKYKVEVTFRFSDNRSKKVAYEVVHSGGRERVIINQMKPGKVTLGTFSFAAGREGCVELVSDGGGSASADSAQFTLVGDGEATGASGLPGVLGIAEGGNTLISLTAENPGSKKVTISADAKIQAKVCLRTYGAGSLKITVNEAPWISWSRSDSNDGSKCVENENEVGDSIYEEKPGDPSAREVKMSREVKKGDILEATLEGQDFRGENTFVVVERISQSGISSETTPIASDSATTSDK
ncbi:MAG: hypothetical protein WA705_22475 [Candidatus Ozemobacteraceae bacterium]